MTTDAARQPWYRPRNIVFALAALVLIFIVWAGSWVYWALTVKPNIAVDYTAQIERLASDSQPPGKNGWHDIASAIDIFRELDQAFPDEDRVRPELGFFQFDLLGYTAAEARARSHLFEEEIPLFEDIIAELHRFIEWLEENGLWDAIASASAKPNIVMPIESPKDLLFDVRISDLAVLQNIARLNRSLLRLAIIENDVPSAVRYLESVFTLGRACSGQPWNSWFVTSHSIHWMLVPVISDSVFDRVLTPEMTAALFDVITDNPPPTDMTIALECDRLEMLDLIQRLYSDDGEGSGTLLYARFGPLHDSGWPTFASSAKPSHPVNNVRGLVYASRREVTDEANATFDQLLAMSRASSMERTAMGDAIKARSNSLDWRFDMLTSTMRDRTGTIESLTWHVSQYDATRILLAIELYRAAHDNAPPRSLADLVPEFLDSLPIDARSNTSFGYRLLTDDEHSRDYLLYSFGKDGVDHNGEEPKSRQEHRSIDPDGFDYVINRAPDSW